MTDEELEKEAKVFANNGYALGCTKTPFESAKAGFLAGAEPREKRIEELDKENGKLEGKLADLQSEYVELENFKNNEINELKEQLTKAKEIIQAMLKDIPNRMWYTDGTIKEAEQLLKEADE